MTFEYPLYTLWYYAVIISMWNLYKINKFTAAEYCSQKKRHINQLKHIQLKPVQLCTSPLPYARCIGLYLKKSSYKVDE